MNGEQATLNLKKCQDTECELYFGINRIHEEMNLKEELGILVTALQVIESLCYCLQMVSMYCMSLETWK